MSTSEVKSVEFGHCGKYCPNWVCDVEPKWDDLCVGCPCNDEEDDENGELEEDD